MVIDMTKAAYATYTQTPTCGYAVTYTYSWTLPTGTIPITAVGATLEINTTDKTKAGNYSVTLATTVNETGSTGSTTSHTQPTVTFTVIVIDPCTETVITAPTIAAPSMTLKVDTDLTFDFLEAVDSLETS